LSFEELPNLIYTFVLAPLAFGLIKTFSNSNRIGKIETENNFLKENVAQLCKSNQAMEKEFKKMAFNFGRLDEHLRNTSQDK